MDVRAYIVQSKILAYSQVVSKWRFGWRYHSIKLWCNRIEKVVGKYVGEIGTRVANLTHFYINILGNGLYLLQEIFSYLRLTDDDVAESGGKELESSRNDT